MKSKSLVQWNDKNRSWIYSGYERYIFKFSTYEDEFNIKTNLGNYAEN